MKWQIKKRPVIKEYEQNIKEALSAIASRGFVQPSGWVISAISDTVLDTKLKLVETNAAIYAEDEGLRFKEETEENKLLLDYIQLDIENTQAEIKRILDIELAELKAELDKLKADVDKERARLNIIEADTIRRKADIDYEKAVMTYKIIEEEGKNLDKTLQLLYAELLTMQERIKAIPIHEQINEAKLELLNQASRNLDKTVRLLEAQLAVSSIRLQAIPYQAQINQLKELIAEIEGTIIEEEIELINAEKATAEERKKIIQPLNEMVRILEQIIDILAQKEPLIKMLTEVERRLVVEKQLLIDEMMITLDKRLSHLNKVKESIPIRKKLIELETEKIILEAQRRMNNAIIRLKEAEYEQLRTILTKAEMATAEANMQSRLEIANTRADIARELINEKRIRISAKAEFEALKTFASRIEGLKLSTNIAEKKIDLEKSIKIEKENIHGKAVSAKFYSIVSRVRKKVIDRQARILGQKIEAWKGSLPPASSMPDIHIIAQVPERLR